MKPARAITRYRPGASVCTLIAHPRSRAESRSVDQREDDRVLVQHAVHLQVAHQRAGNAGRVAGRKHGYAWRAQRRLALELLEESRRPAAPRGASCPSRSAGRAARCASRRRPRTRTESGTSRLSAPCPGWTMHEGRVDEQQAAQQPNCDARGSRPPSPQSRIRISTVSMSIVQETPTP